MNPKIAQKYIKVEVSNENTCSINKFIKEVFEADIHSKLDPNHNFEILAKHLQLAINKHIPQKKQKNSINVNMLKKIDDTRIADKIVKKNSLYVKWKTTAVTHASYDNAKASFKNCEREILKTIQVAKHDNYVFLVKTQISKVIGILHRLKNIFPKETLKTFYTSLIASYLNYGLLLWGIESHKVEIMQKKLFG